MDLRSGWRPPPWGSRSSPSACGGSSSKGKELKSIGPGEGALSLIAWAGYAENGSNDPKVNWVGPFEKATGCKTTVKVAGTSDEMVTLMKTGQYDSVSASGNASQRLMASEGRRADQRLPAQELRDDLRPVEGPGE